MSSTGGGALARTLATASLIATTDLLVKMSLIFGGGVQLFVEQQDAQSASYYWAKWGYWAARNLFFTTVYALIVALPHTEYRDMLPARPAVRGGSLHIFPPLVLHTLPVSLETAFSTR